MVSALVTFSLYLILLIGIGGYFYLNTSNRRLQDYMLAERDVSVWPMAISEAATVASGFTFFAWVAAGFAVGLNGIWFALAYVLVTLVMYRVIGPKLRIDSEELESITIIDHIVASFEQKDGDTWADLIRIVGAVAVVIFMTAYISSQIIAVGELFDTGLGIDYTYAIVIGGLAVGLYTGLGGLNASVWTDLVQGILVLFTVLALPVLMVAEIGGITAVVNQAAAIDPTLLSLTGGMSGRDYFLFGIMLWFFFAPATIGYPHAMMRFQSISSERLLSRASVISITFGAIRMTVPLFIGICSRILYADTVNNPENVAMIAIPDFFPAWLAGLLLAGVASAVLSTTDSMMIAAGADVTRLYEKYVNPDVADRRLILFGRLFIVTMAVLGVALAYLRLSTIFDIIFFAAIGLGVTLGVPLVFVLFWERTTSQGVLAAMVVGLSWTIVHAFYLYTEFWPFLAWPVPIIVILLVSYATGEHSTVERADIA